MNRRSYASILRINGRFLKNIVIDSHYEKKHSSSITDELIIQLVYLLNSGRFESESIDVNGFEYYTNNDLELNGKRYRLIWLLHHEEDYVGVINAHRRKK